MKLCFTGFFPTAVIEQPLNKEDGEFVDSIHSDVFLIGTKSSTGHADFYTNYGWVQPNCPPLNFETFYNFVSCEFWFNKLDQFCINFLQQRCAVTTMPFVIGFKVWSQSMKSCFKASNAQTGSVTPKEDVTRTLSAPWESKLIRGSTDLST